MNKNFLVTAFALSLAVTAVLILGPMTAQGSNSKTIVASIAGNIKDVDYDGLGDIHDPLPGPSPILMSSSPGDPNVQGTRRMQFEFDISSLGCSSGIESATVSLSTFKGTVDKLDTFFFHGNTEQDGVLTNSDFQAPATQIAGVLMPVVGGSSTFSFDVTALLQADNAIGRTYFSVQGRVDETLAGFSNARGLQVRTTATGNPLGLTQPQLIVTCVNEPPVANDDFVNTNEDTPFTFDVAANDTDDDGNLDPSTTTATTSTIHGSLTNNGDGTFGYDPDLNYNGSDGFSYEICNSEGLCDTASVSITINPVNDAPIAVFDSHRRLARFFEIGVAGGLLNNDFDIDGDDLEVISYDAVSVLGGEVVVNSDGSFSYSPSDRTLGGYDRFTYVISDGNGGTSEASVFVTATPWGWIGVDVRSLEGSIFGNTISGQFLVTDDNENGKQDKFDVQLQSLEIDVEFRVDGEWVEISNSSCDINPDINYVASDHVDPDTLFVFSEQVWADFHCTLPDGISRDQVVRITAWVEVAPITPNPAVPWITIWSTSVVIGEKGEGPNPNPGRPSSPTPTSTPTNTPTATNTPTSTPTNTPTPTQTPIPPTNTPTPTPEPTEPPPALPDLIVSSLTVTSLTATSIDYCYEITNIGNAPANLDGPTAAEFDNVNVQAFVSADTIFRNAGDVAAGGTILGSSPLGFLNPGEIFSGCFGSFTSVDTAVTPFLLLMVDFGQRVSESNETNNVTATLIQ